MKEFSSPADIGKHIRKGDVTAFCTGTPGQFELCIRNGYPDNTTSEEYPISIRLGIQVKGEKSIMRLIIESFHMTIKRMDGVHGDNQRNCQQVISLAVPKFNTKK